ncbi:MAG: DUF1801 domain-containing protein [Deltaproteobacteria bacterium]|nr:DUF1801 domain-containing protein [Deltaproteobacteria bacterium]
MKIDAKDPDDYVSKVAPERRPEIETLRRLVRRAVPQATESIVWGMIGYGIGGRPFAAIASQKAHLSLYLMDLYTQPRLRERHASALAGVKMGKSCLQFRRADELPLDTIAAILAEAPNVTVTTGTLSSVGAEKAPAKKKAPARTAPVKKAPARTAPAKKKTPVKKAPAKKAPAKKAPATKVPAKKVPAKKVPATKSAGRS